jgi:hypothetical protein
MEVTSATWVPDLDGSEKEQSIDRYTTCASDFVRNHLRISGKALLLDTGQSRALLLAARLISAGARISLLSSSDHETRSFPLSFT